MRRSPKGKNRVNSDFYQSTRGHYFLKRGTRWVPDGELKIMFIKIKLLVFLCLWSTYALSANFTPTINLPNTSMTTNELVDIANSTYRHLVDLNGSDKTKGTLKIDHVELELPISDKDIKNFPKEGYSADLSFNSYEEKINRLVVNLSDYSSELSLSGSDKDYINVLKNNLLVKFSEHQRNFTGVNFRFFIMFIILIFGMFFLPNLTKLFLKILNISSESKNYDKISSTIFIILFPSYLLLGIFMPYILKPIFPGFYISETNLAWYDEYSGIIGLISFVFPLTVFAYKGFKRNRVAKFIESA
ncbi:hypothetical protein N9W34_01235 [Rickettsiales bacterium]|nr:hypothetical protein [Rickettsiales bacterium]